MATPAPTAPTAPVATTSPRITPTEQATAAYQRGHAQALLEPCVLVIFGASGDLTQRKLVPALFELDKQGRLPEKLCVVGVSRTAMSDDQFRERMLEGAKKHASGFDEARWPEFAKRLHYYAGDAAENEVMTGLSQRVKDLGREREMLKQGEMPNVLFYLSVAPSLYEPIIASIGAADMVAEGHRWCSLNPEAMAWQRIIVEKPFGTDLATTISLNRALGRVFEEESIFRIDHYLGKELVQNTLVMRFANTIFEPLWNSRYVEHIQVTANETVGVGSRAANFYDEAGAMRDMIQSHLLQVLCLVTMEPPSSYSADAIMREKIKLLASMRELSSDQIASSAVLGRYAAGGNEPAYVEEKGVQPERRTETFGAVRLHIDNWRWSGVPFYIRSGKRMASKLTEIVVQFKPPAHDIFRKMSEGGELRPGNRLIINIAPREGISLRIEGKVPGSGLVVDSAKLDLDYLQRFGGEVTEAYGPLILDAVRGDRTLYKHKDEVEQGWRIFDPILKSAELRRSIAEYAPLSWGPAAADALIAQGSPEGTVRKWHNPQTDEVR